MTESIQIYLDRVIEFAPRLIESLQESGIMLSLASVAAIFIGIPLGTLLYLTALVSRVRTFGFIRFVIFL